jgi:hypothetical protein
VLLRNEQRLDHHWARIKLIGKTANRDAIGARVKIRVGNRTIVQQVMPTKGYLSRSELPLTFGLGKATAVSETEVVWPGGSRQRVENLRLDSLTIVSEQPR